MRKITVESNRSILEMAREYGVHETTVRGAE